MLVNKGQIIIFTKGDYSDYEITTLAVATKPFNLKLKMADWQSIPSIYKDTGVDFTSYLVLHKVIKLVEHTEVHTDNYGAIKIDDEIGWY